MYSPGTVMGRTLSVCFCPFTHYGYLVMEPILQHAHIGGRITRSIPSNMRILILGKDKWPKRLWHINSSPCDERDVVSFRVLFFVNAPP